MNRFRSLRFRLQFWNALLLLSALLGFGGVLRWQMHRLQWDQVDSGLLAYARIIEGSMRGASRGVIDSLTQDLGFPPGPLSPPATPKDGKKRLPKQKAGPPPRIMVPPDDLRARRPNELDINWSLLESPEFAAKTDSEWEAGLRLPRDFPPPVGQEHELIYFIVWRGDRTVLDEANPPTSKPTAIGPGDPRFQRERYVMQQRDEFREIFVRGPRHTMICVGRSVVEEEYRAQRRDLVLGLTGLGIFGIGLAGSWWLSRKATEPVEAMSRTAAAIGPDNLQARMDSTKLDVELSQLGSVLNSMLDRLETSFKRQQQFTADASHELRTPLSVILATTEHALSKDRSPEDYRECLESSHRSADRMRRLVESLLALARFDAKTDSIEQTDCRLDEIVNECVSHLSSLAESRGIALETKLETVEVRGDRLALSRLVANLIHNAIEYNRPDGSVCVELVNRDEAIELRVSDTGIGIAEGDIGKLFDRFFRADEARSRQKGGSGLGLAICRSIATAHHATIGVQSELGKGSTFTVRFGKNHSQKTSKY
jgi:heavy metal sensor kinase